MLRSVGLAHPAEIMNEGTVKLISAIIDLLKSLAWPAVTIWVILRFRHQFRELLTRLASLKVGGGEFVFQSPPEKPQAQEKGAVNLQTGADGFLSVVTLRAVVAESGLVERNESVDGELLLFLTPQQHTWLVSTTHQIFILLDDEGTRAEGNIIMTHFERSRTLPLKTSVENGAGVVTFAAQKTGWYYSLHLFPTPSALYTAITRLVRDNR
jgi:hypothetical protein